MRRLWHVRFGLRSVRFAANDLGTFVRNLLEDGNEMPLRKVSAAAGQAEELEEELSALKGGLRHYFASNSEQFVLRQDANTGEFFVSKKKMSKLTSDSSTGFFWKHFDVGILLAFIPSYFVSWSTIFDRLPDSLRATLPREQRSRNIVNVLQESCEFFFGFDLLIRRKAGFSHPAVDDQADQLYRDWSFDPDAVLRLAASLKSRQLNGAIEFCSLDEVAGAGFVQEAAGSLGIAKICSLFPTILTRYTVNNKRFIESLLQPPLGTAADCVAQALLASARKNVNRATVEIVIRGTENEVQKAIGASGVSCYLTGNPLVMDNYGFVHVPSEGQKSFAGMFVPIEPSPKSEVDAFREIDTGKRWRTKERLKERDKDSIFRNEAVLLDHVMSALSDTEYMKFCDVSAKLDPQAKCWFPQASMLKFVLRHSDVLDLRQTFDKSTTYFLRKRRTGETPVPEEKVTYSPEDLMSFVQNACFYGSVSFSSMWAKLPLAVREQFGSPAALMKFLRASKQFDIVETESSAVISLKSPPQ